jgi:serine/threonine protein phosphatase PrpC
MVSVQSFSEAGADHSNEDAFALRQHPLDPDLWLCFVADGQGGRAGGGPAAQLACQVGLDAVIRCPPERLGEPPVWSGVLRTIDEAVRADPTAGFTTVVGLCVRRNQVIGASSGDSAALLVTATRTVELTAGQRKNPPVGSGMAVPVPFAATPDKPWQVLTMSDGVWKYVGWDRVIEAARRDRGAALVAELQRSARLPGSGRFPDDFTVVVFEGSA